MKNRRLYALVLPLMAGMVLLQGCGAGETVVGTAAVLTYFGREDVNLVQKNYAAADYLEQQIKSYVGRNAPVKVVALSDIQSPEIYAPIAGVIPQQVGERLMQLGYNVDISEVASKAELKFRKGPQNPGYILSGSYKKNRRDMEISLRMTGAQTGNLIGSFNYVLPYDREIRELSEPQAKIMRTTTP